MKCNVQITATIGKLKEQVHDKTAWPLDRIILSCNGADLSEPDRNLNSLNLGFGTKDQIFMQARLRLMGGMMDGVDPMGGMMDGVDPTVS